MRRRPRQGRQPGRTCPRSDAVVKAAFASDIGVDNEALRTGNGGYVWYDVTGIEPSREKTLDEVRDQVAAQWREDQVAQRLSEKARQLTERLDKGEAIEAVAPGGRRAGQDRHGSGPQRRQGRSHGRGRQPHLRGAGRQGRQRRRTAPIPAPCSRSRPPPCRRSSPRRRRRRTSRTSSATASATT